MTLILLLALCQLPQRPVLTSDSPLRRSVMTQAAPDDCGLAEVNAYRAKRGLRPFLPDPDLAAAARACASQRAARNCHGHLPEGDFRYLPAGSHAAAAGCGALEPSWGWATCCMDGSYTYAGAAVVTRGGLRFMHLFVK